MRPPASFVYLGLTFAISWSLWLLSGLGPGLPRWAGYLPALGPALGALGALAFTSGRTGIRQWIDRSLGALGGRSAWTLPVGGLVLAFVVGVGADRVLSGTWSSLTGLGKTAELPGWEPWAVAGLLIVSYGFCEELGWRGWLFPRWAERWGPVRAAWAVAGVWCLWHAPAFWFNPTYQAMGWGALGWALSLAAGSFFLGWMVTASGGSLWPVVAWHAGFDFVTVSDSAAPFLAPFLSMTVLLAWPFTARALIRPAAATRPAPSRGPSERSCRTRTRASR